jgi:predicted ATPase
MYFKSIELENVGPIDYLQLRFPISAEGTPKPLVIVGENGSGKTILLSHIVNTLISCKQTAYDDCEVEQGKVYKYRSPQYIQSGQHYSYARTELDSGLQIEEWQLDVLKSEFETAHSFAPIKPSWQAIPPDQASDFASTFRHGDARARGMFEKKCCLYFPVNRFEEPAWLNIDNLTSRAKYTELKHIDRQSNRNIISTSPLKENRNWLLDLIFDRQAFEINTQILNLPTGDGQPNLSVPVFAGYQGQSSKIYEAVLDLLRTTLRTDGAIRLGAGSRRNRQISIMKNEAAWIPNIFQLSTGEVLLLNLFLSILRDYDLSGGAIENLTDIKGIVVIDEIDAHLHTSHQKEILPELIASFPGVQFIITTHSPLFLLGMEGKFGADGFSIINMPTGEAVAAPDFSEFTAAYEAFKETTHHRQEVANVIKSNSRPIVFVEGDYDIRYITKAAELLGKTEVLNSIQLRDGSGFGNLDKIWRSYENQLAELLPSKILLLYDCDTNKTPAEKGQLTKRIIPTIDDNPIKIGIENLLPGELISKIEGLHPEFIDVTQTTSTRVRGQTIVSAERRSTNKDEKGNLCKWVCENGTEQDFRHFESVFQLIEDAMRRP